MGDLPPTRNWYASRVTQRVLGCFLYVVWILVGYPTVTVEICSFV